ncbi:cysteine synthase A [Streptomyces sp. 1114.5]|uniref:pyridoxal-phosphate dependent enzyme n=1 Tax=Streptomyces sp. 1114.5 TaxID=1938830 RepID=UPI000EAF5E72|nr:pyridoxal-phosphate dependent enzyme [Streptomyces sp. 1114.5]RKT17072.1 cysteine synthase A [Streptomyces sp. 1114.5]
MAGNVYRETTEALLLPRIIRLGGNLYGAAFTLMKLVPARHILLKAEESGLLGPETSIVETTSGTFGLALAMQASLMRRRLTLVSDPAIDANLHRRLTDLGARIEICAEPAEVGGYQEARLRRLAEVRAEQPDSFCPEQYSNPDNPASYALVAEHLERALGEVDCLVGPVGSGGSMCGTVRGLRSGRPGVRAIGVDTPNSVLFGHPDDSRVLRGLGNSLMPANLDHRDFDEVHWCTAGEAFAATRRLHGRHALFQGPTSGAAYLVARWWADQNPDAKVVVMLPDEGYRYQETVYDDAWLASQGHTAPPPSAPVEVDDPTRPTHRWSRYAWNRRSLAEVVGGARTLAAVR